jgi:peptide/nickel transport system permease protein
MIQRRSRIRRTSRRSRVPLAIMLAAAAAILVFAPGGDLSHLSSASPMLSPSLAHPLGTDDLGRDLCTAVAQGMRTSLLVGAGVTLIAQLIGITVGLVAGLAPPLLDEVLMRAADIAASLPTLIIAILVAALFGGSISALVLVIGFTRWPVLARLVRVEAASLRTREFVLAAQALGVGPLRIAVAHILPAAITPALAATGILFGGALVSEAALAFVGLGDPSVTSLGQLAASGFAFVDHAPWMWIGPTVAIVLMTSMIAVVADHSLDEHSMSC